MKLEVVKKGQGKQARGLAYLLGGGLVLFGAISLFAFINRQGQFVWVSDVPVIGQISLYNVIATASFALGLLALHLFLNRPSFVDLLIDTELEMRKVSWPTKKEVQNATIIVVFVTVLLAVMLYGFDWLLQLIFKLILGG
jgi:preprotein translocase subunit SecE